MMPYVQKAVVSLVGLPLAGKSTLGQALARTLHCPHYELDALVETHIGKPIHRFLSKDTEAAFRQTEAQMLKDCLHHPTPFVLSLGGGTPCVSNTMSRLRDAGPCIFLDISWRALYARLKQTPLRCRPLIQAMTSAKEPIPSPRTLQKHLSYRLPFYQKAHFQLSVDHKDLHQLTQEALQLLQQTPPLRS